MQLADELPMIYTACIMAYATLTYSKSPRFSLVAAAGTIAVAWSITVSFSEPDRSYPLSTVSKQH